jgi:hypothetical protein
LKIFVNLVSFHAFSILSLGMYTTHATDSGYERTDPSSVYAKI